MVLFCGDINNALLPNMVTGKGMEHMCLHLYQHIHMYIHCKKTPVCQRDLIEDNHLFLQHRYAKKYNFKKV